MTYEPRPSAIERYETAGDRTQAGIRLSYRALVNAAFAGLVGGDHFARYGATPPPDVPAVDMTLSMLS